MGDDPVMRSGEAELRRGQGVARGVSKMGFYMFAGVHNSRLEMKTGRQNAGERVIFVTNLEGPPVVNDFTRWTRAGHQGADLTMPAGAG